MVGQHQRAQGIALALNLHHPGAGADAPLEAVAAHAAPGAHRAFGKILRRIGKRRQHIRFPHMQAADVVEVAIVALKHHRVYRAGLPANGFVLRQHMAAQRRPCRARGQRVGEHDGRLQLPKLLHLHQPQRFAKAVEHLHGGGQLFLKAVAGVRQDGRHARLHRPVGQRGMPHQHARHIGQQVARTGGQAANADTVGCVKSH